MRPGAPDEVLNVAAGWKPQMASWVGTSLLAENIPMQRGVLSVDSRQEVPERLTFSVPAYADQRSWIPGVDTRAPLARFGQFIESQIIVRSVTNGTEYPTRLPRTYIQGWDLNDPDGDIDVEALGLLQRVKTDRFRIPESPKAGNTLAAEFKRLMPGGIPVIVDPALVDRACPTSFQWTDDRLGALYDIVDAWPARMRVSSSGVVNVLPPLSDTPVPEMTFKDGEDGTLVSAPRSDTRDGVYNSVVARATQTDDPAKAPVWAEAVLPAGPLSTNGDYGVVRKFFASPLITTLGQAQAAANTMLANSQRPSRIVTCQIAPDPRVDIDVPVRVIRDGITRIGWVIAYSLPLTVKGGKMTVTVGVTNDAV